MDKQLSGGLLLNLVAPGFGHIYCGEKKKGLIILSGYPLIIVHLHSYRMNYGADHCVNSYIDIVKMLEHKAYEK